MGSFPTATIFWSRQTMRTRTRASLMMHVLVVFVMLVTSGCSEEPEFDPSGSIASDAEAPGHRQEAVEIVSEEQELDIVDWLGFERMGFSLILDTRPDDASLINDGAVRGRDPSMPDPGLLVVVPQGGWEHQTTPHLFNTGTPAEVQWKPDRAAQLTSDAFDINWEQVAPQLDMNPRMFIDVTVETPSHEHIGFVISRPVSVRVRLGNAKEIDIGTCRQYGVLVYSRLDPRK